MLRSVSESPAGAHLPVGIESTPLDVALLVAGLRELYRHLRFKAETASSEIEQQLCFHVMREIEQLIEGQGARRKVWEAAKADLVRDLVGAINDPDCYEQLCRREK